MKRTYEDSTAAERLEQQTAQSLTQGWTLWNSTDPFIVIARLLLSASITGSMVSLINTVGNPPLLIMVFVMVQLGAVLWFLWQYQGRFHRFSFVSALCLGFVFAMDWSFVEKFLGSVL